MTQALLTFRRARPSDISDMSAIRLSVTENALSDPSRITADMYLRYLDELGRGWVCELDGEIIGFSFAALSDHSIWALFVRPSHEGLGAGRQLLALACEWLFEHGASCVSLGTAANTRADRFYARQGWRRGAMLNAVEVAYVLDRPATSIPDATETLPGL